MPPRCNAFYLAPQRVASPASLPSATQGSLGSIEGTNWIYIDESNGNSASKCMENWSYYSYGGSLIKANISRTTRVDSGGRENEQPW